MKETTLGIILLVSTGNNQSTYKFYGLHTGEIATRTHYTLLPITPEALKRFIETRKEKNSNLGIQLFNQQKEILDHIEPDDVEITGVYYEELKEPQNKEEEEEYNDY